MGRSGSGSHRIDDGDASNPFQRSNFIGLWVTEKQMSESRRRAVMILFTEIGEEDGMGVGRQVLYCERESV